MGKPNGIERKAITSLLYAVYRIFIETLSYQKLYPLVQGTTVLKIRQMYLKNMFSTTK